MKTSRKLRDVHALETYRVILSQAISSPEITEALEKNGFNTDIMKKGSGLIERAREIFDTNLRKKNELSFAHANFARRKKKIERKFREHRSKARLLFRKESLEADKLAINGYYPSIYAQWIETVRRFYSVVAADREIQSALLQLCLSPEEINTCLTDLEVVENLQAAYIMHKGDARLLTKKKNEAFKELQDWMRVFIGSARLALKDKPELLAALKRHVD